MCRRLSCPIHNPLARRRARKLAQQREDDSHIAWAAGLVEQGRQDDRKLRGQVAYQLAAGTAPTSRVDQPRVIDLRALSLDAVAGIMNGLNTSPEPFACEADRRAFSDASLEVVIRWEKLTDEEKLERNMRKWRG